MAGEQGIRNFIHEMKVVKMKKEGETRQDKENAVGVLLVSECFFNSRHDIQSVPFLSVS
jgi:hypothetical protein